jgi:hypothetical protein
MEELHVDDGFEELIGQRVTKLSKDRRKEIGYDKQHDDKRSRNNQRHD